jgi:hypothetical protein
VARADELLQLLPAQLFTAFVRSVLKPRMLLRDAWGR